MITVDILPILRDNYCYIITSRDGKTAVLDPGDAPPVMAYLEKKNIKPDFILNTHHHGDHTGGNNTLKTRYGCPIIAPEIDATKIRDADHILKDGDIFMLGRDAAQIIHTPGHTIGGICFYFRESGVLFTGDTLFSMGCGRLFEGSATDMFEGFLKITNLPDETLIYCGHEYTLSNARFALSLDPDNSDLHKRVKEAQALRAQDKPTLPVLLGIEKKTNPFLRAKNAEDFAALRLRKDEL